MTTGNFAEVSNYYFPSQGNIGQYQIFFPGDNSILGNVLFFSLTTDH